MCVYVQKKGEWRRTYVCIESRDWPNSEGLSSVGRKSHYRWTKRAVAQNITIHIVYPRVSQSAKLRHHSTSTILPFQEYDIKWHTIQHQPTHSQTIKQSLIPYSLPSVFTPIGNHTCHNMARTQMVYLLSCLSLLLFLLSYFLSLAPASCPRQARYKHRTTNRRKEKGKRKIEKGKKRNRGNVCALEGRAGEEEGQILYCYGMDEMSVYSIHEKARVMEPVGDSCVICKSTVHMIKVSAHCVFPVGLCLPAVQTPAKLPCVLASAP